MDRAAPASEGTAVSKEEQVPAMALAMKCKYGASSCTTEGVLHPESSAARGQVTQSSSIHAPSIDTFHSLDIFKIPFGKDPDLDNSSDLEAGPAVNRGWAGALQRCFQ